MEIIVVCGAGASSTFIARRLERAAEAAQVAVTAHASTRSALAHRLPGADLVLVGPQLRDELPQLRAIASSHAVALVALPDDIMTDLDGTRALALLRAVVPLDARASV